MNQGPLPAYESKWRHQIQDLHGLFLVASPIGHWEDFSIRGIETLKHVHGILCEDTRVTKGLLAHYHIEKPCYSYDQHREKEKLPWVMERLHHGQSLALLSDRGTPLISDPGSLLVQACILQNIPVHSIPGPCSAIIALTLSGLSSEKFFFQGFLPRASSQRAQALVILKDMPCSIIIFEAPHRLRKTLEALLHVFGNRHICIARELTKKFEECLRGSLEQVLASVINAPPKGEIILVVEGHKKSKPSATPTPHQKHLIEGFLKENTLHRSNIQDLSLTMGVSPTLLYTWCLEVKKSFHSEEE